MSEDFCEMPVGDELLIYDNRSRGCHSLSPQAVRVLSLHREGLHEDEISESLASNFPELKEESHEIVARLLSHLQELGLIKAENAALSSFSPSRRRVLQIAGVALVSSVLVPQAAAACSRTQLFVQSASYGADSVGTLARCGSPNSAPASPGTFIDVTGIVQAAVVGTPGSVTIAASNANFTDPISGTIKELITVHCCPGATLDVTTYTCENANFSVTCL